ncbi:MAG: helix-turn-helix domain-containing protein [Rhodoblastus sp.]
MSVTIRHVMNVVAAAYSLTLPQLMSDTKAREIVHARQIGYWLARRHTPATSSSVGRAFRKDPTTVLAGIVAVEARRRDPGFALELAALDATIATLVRTNALAAIGYVDGLAVARRIDSALAREAPQASVVDIAALARRVIDAEAALERAATLVGLLADPQAFRDEARLAAAAGLLAIDLEALGVIQPEQEKPHVAA